MSCSNLVYDFYECLSDKNIKNMKNTSKNKKFLELYLNKIYSDIFQSYLYSKKTKIKKKLFHTDKKFDKKMRPNMYDSKFFPKHIKEYTEKNLFNIITYSCTVYNKNINLYFYVYDKKRDIQIIDNYVKLMIMWIYMLNSYSYNKCSKNLDVYIYLTPFEKKLPKNYSTVLDTEHVNTAYTTTCPINGEIIIFRKEEWFKVFVHETFHTFGLDFSEMNQDKVNKKIRSLFPINSDINLYEAYCETWAKIINISLLSFDILENKTNKQLFFSNCEIFLEVEKQFVLFQCNKILAFMGLEYDNLYKNDLISRSAREKLYKEHTNVFSYYIITGILFNNYLKFLAWCNKYNKNVLYKFKNSENTLMNFCNLIELLYNDNDFSKTIKDIAISKKISNYNKLLNTTRLSIIELN